MGKTKKKSGKEKEKEHGRVGEGEIEMPHEIPKLVLKVGKEKKPKDDTSTRDDGEHSHHKKKKKKHKHRNEEIDKKVKKREITEVNETETPTKKIHLRVSKEKEKKETFKEQPVSALDLCLENLHRNLQRKDVYGIFTFPVTDLIAPGYSKIIKTPMDFLTMSKKIGDSEYSSLDQFRDDFVVMCNNAMLYNGSDTIYYKSAEKMLQLGLKMLSKEKLSKLNKSIGLPVSDSEDDDVTIDDSSDVNIDSLLPEEASSPACYSPPKRRRENRPASVTAAVLAASRRAREELLRKRPNQLFGYLAKGTDGENVLNILNPDTTEENKSVPVTIGKVAGKLQSGILPGEQVVKEEKKNKVIPVNYLLYGPYGSFGPSYDSSLSNTTKEESDLLLQTYGSEGGVEYVKSLMNFTKDTYFARDYVDGIIDALTNGAHKKCKEISSSDAKGDIDGNTNKTKDVQSNVDISSLLTLDGVGIDVTFLKNMVQPEAKEISSNAAPPELSQNDLVKAKLIQNADMLHTLKQTQNSRLSTKYGGAAPIPPGEIRVASSITDNLKDLMGMVTPKDVVSSEGVRKAIGTGNSSMHITEVVEKSNEVVMTSVEESAVQESQLQESKENQVYGTDVPMETT